MYWNEFREMLETTNALINRNMRCIEILLFSGGNISGERLIETWDVLKWQTNIEAPLATIGLIETWDVLKLNNGTVEDVFVYRLIETWDVLKSKKLGEVKLLEED